MNFTEEDILKIQQGLYNIGIKDSELLDAILPLSDTDSITLIQNDNNVKISLKDFTEQLHQLVSLDFINLTTRYNISSETLENAIIQIPSYQRKKGLIITFYNNESLWKTYQFQGELTQFNNPNLWKDITVK